MLECAICHDAVEAGDDVVEFTDGTVAHGACSDAVTEALADER